MALIVKVIRFLLKRLRTSLFVAQRMARYLLSTWRSGDGYGATWRTLAELLIRNLTCQLRKGGVNSCTSEGVIDSDDLVNEDTDSVEGMEILLEEDVHISNLDSEQGKDIGFLRTEDRTVQEQDKIEINVSQGCIIMKNLLITCSDYFLKVSIDALDLAVSEDRLREKLGLVERILYWNPRAFLGLESRSTFTSLSRSSSSSSSSNVSDTASQWDLTNKLQQEAEEVKKLLEESHISIEEVRVQDVPRLSSHGDIYL